MLEAFLYFIVAFLVTSGLIPMLFDVWKEDKPKAAVSSTSSTSSTSVQPNTTAKEKSKPRIDSEEDYQYNFRGQGVAITACYQLECTEAKIPAMIRYTPVFSIDSGAFKNCKNLKKVLLPEHVMYIAPDAFASTEHLTLYGRYDTYAHKYAQEHRIRFRSADSFDTDEQKVYEKSSQTTEAVKSAKTDLPEIMRFDYYDVAKENGGLTIKKFVGVDNAVLTIPAELGGMRVLEIDTGAVSDCRYIEKVIISEGIQAIRNGAFINCPNLYSVVLPSTLKSFGDDSKIQKSTSLQAVFHNCNLKSIKLSPSVINIGKRAFYNCNLLKDIILSDGLEVIGDEAFRGCTALSEILIPKSVQTIGTDVFKTEEVGSNKRNLNITLHCYGGSVGLMYARENNLQYKDAEEWKNVKPIKQAELEETSTPKATTRSNAEQKKKSETVKKIKVKSEAKVNAQKKQEEFSDFSQQITHALNVAMEVAEIPLEEIWTTDGNKNINSQAERNVENKEEKETERKRAHVLLEVHSCFWQIANKRAIESVQKLSDVQNSTKQIIEQKTQQKEDKKISDMENEIAATEYGRVIRHSKYTVIFRVSQGYKEKDSIDGEMIVWQDINRISWPLKTILGCEYFKNGKQEAYCGRLTRLPEDEAVAIGNIQFPKNGLVIHFKGHRPYVILDFIRNSENLQKTYNTLKYVIGSNVIGARIGRSPFRCM